MAFSVVGLLGALVLGGAATANLRDVGPIVLLVAIIAGFIAIVVTSMKIRKVFPFATFIDDAAVTLTLPSPEAERLFQQHLSAGARRAA